MSTYALKLKNIRKEFPDYGDVIERLEEVLAEAAPLHAEYSLDHIYELVHANSLGQMSELLVWLVKNHFVETIVRVKTPSGIGLRDYSSLGELPPSIFDNVETGSEIPVRDDNIEILYRIRAA